jgi:hypothetical protein
MQGAVEDCYEKLAKERSTYMNKCKRVREEMSGEYDDGADKGIAKKLLKKIIR